MTYIVGSHWFICDVCGQKYRSHEKKKRWDGLIVCPSDYEVDHPQKYIRVDSDGQAVPDPRPRPEDVFALPVYCTPITRTAAADDGTADCMTVDYYLNINYRDYNAYQPIIPETAAITPVLLDTFTAANGTDPTSRDMDAFLTGQARWEQSGASSVGDIQSNAFGPSGTSGGSWTDALIAYALPSAAAVMGNAYPFAVVLRGVRRYANSCRAYAYIDGSGYDAIDLLWTTDTLQAELTADNGSGGWDDVTVTYSLAQGDGASHNFALWTDGTTLHLLLNGVDVGQQSYSIGDVLPNRLELEITGSGTPDSEPRDQIASFGYYEGLTLAQATALTV